mgnify:CR=1 FL=1
MTAPAATPASPLLTIPQLAEMLGCAHSTLYAQVRAGTLPYPVVRLGAEVRVPRDAVLLANSGALAALDRNNAATERLADAFAGLCARLDAVFGGFAAAFPVAASAAGMSPAGTGVTAIPSSVRSSDEGGEKSQEGLCREQGREPVEGRAAESPQRVGGHSGGAAAHRGLRAPARSPRSGGAAVARTPLPAARKTKRPPATEGRVVG